MDKLIAAFPNNMIEALSIASKAQISKNTHEIRNILITGMGGSGIGGKIVALWLQDELSVPVTLINDYNLPEFVNEHTLVIASSYSGNTEETLMSLYKAHEKGARIIGICSGGDLQEFCAKNSYNCILVPGGNPPRTQLAFSVVQLVNIFVQLGLCSSKRLDEIKSANELLVSASDTIKTEARKLADFLDGKVGVFYSSARYEGVAIRARQQFEENSKYLCWHHVIPEMNHNELVGWGGGDDRFAVVFMQTGDLIPRNQKRYDITMDRIKTFTPYVTEIVAKGTCPIERSFYLIHLVDWSSLYLAQKKGVDEFDIDVIYYLKDELAKFQG
jgi:glucose/mannose-6-phosphate isomerase